MGLTLLPLLCIPSTVVPVYSPDLPSALQIPKYNCPPGLLNRANFTFPQQFFLSRFFLLFHGDFVPENGSCPLTYLLPFPPSQNPRIPEF